MNQYFEIIFLSIIQGFTEYLPISSSGHLSLAQELMGLTDQKALGIFLHIPSFFAILIYFYKPILKSTFPIKQNIPFIRSLIIASVVTVVFVLIFKDMIDESFTNIFRVGIEFFITTGILLISKFIKPKRFEGKVNLKQSIAAGLAQGLAVFPAISRSATTITCMTIMGVKQEYAGFFSMVMALVAIFGAVVLEYEVLLDLNYSIAELTTAFLVTLVVSLLSISVLMKTLQKGSFYLYAIWTTLMGIVCIYIS